ncbi:OLC1v1005138C1 [Oldenlandia corymbosa var. corymbosa]|uniref:OLC1v1005138C1 n=1 Tax=Oldenlandia corymbosa var. corymbosa TaxID=529605 RepID=A0AAV1DGD0_OLDCO|nr:OLC1v1005138C1 [Oldenlandia corymbosa var. corymbosa]
MEMITIEDDDHIDDCEIEESLKIQKFGDGVSWKRGRLLGEGGFGAVFIATMKHHHPAASPKVRAVKSAEVSNSDSLRLEKKVLSRLVGCPNIIQCLGEEVTRGVNGSEVYNILLEYGSGGSLAERIYNSRGKGLLEYEVQWYTRSILKGLMKIHGAGFVHRDLEPDNILLVPRNRESCLPKFNAKICDFGLAKPANQDRKKKRKLSDRTWWGTLMYLGPEAVREARQEPPGDMWALRCVVLETLTGIAPWYLDEKALPPAEQEGDYLLKKLHGGRAAPKIPEQLSKDAKSFLKCCFYRTPKNRATAKTLLFGHPFVNGLRDEDGFCPGGGVVTNLVEEMKDSKELPWLTLRGNLPLPGLMH